MYQGNYRKKQDCCLICYKSFSENISLSNIFSFNNIICNNCIKKLKVINKKEVVNGVLVWFLYEYNSFMKTLLYQYKGCYDIVLKDVFLYAFKNKISKKYKNYTIVFPPSNEEDDKKRGFVHIEKMIECLKIKHLNLFYKVRPYKQSDHKYNKRYMIKDIIKAYDIKVNKNEKILIIDDIFTSGSTLKTIIDLLIKKGIKKENIKAIIISKTADFVEL